MLFTVYLVTSLLAMTGTFLYDIYNGSLKRAQICPEIQKRTLKKTLPVIGINLMSAYPVIYFYEWWNMNREHTQIPIFLLVPIIALTSDFFFYMSHRLFHQRIWIPWVGSVNLYEYHKIHHEFTETTSIAALYAHPIDNLVANFIPLTLPIAYFNPERHYLYGMIIFGVLKSIIWAHGNYIFSSNFHEMHHRTFIYNYGSSRFFDKLFGTLHPDFGSVFQIKGIDLFLNKIKNKKIES